jgi:hypothetical protein
MKKRNKWDVFSLFSWIGTPYLILTKKTNLEKKKSARNTYQYKYDKGKKKNKKLSVNIHEVKE